MDRIKTLFRSLDYGGIECKPLHRHNRHRPQWILGQQLFHHSKSLVYSIRIWSISTASEPHNALLRSLWWNSVCYVETQTELPWTAGKRWDTVSRRNRSPFYPIARVRVRVGALALALASESHLVLGPAPASYDVLTSKLTCGMSCSIDFVCIAVNFRRGSGWSNVLASGIHVLWSLSRHSLWEESCDRRRVIQLDFYIWILSCRRHAA